MYKQKWNQLVDLHTKNLLAQESIVQNLWEIAFVELFGYSRLNGELDSHRTLRIGSTERVIPDIIIKENEKDIFIVELKQHNKYFDGGMERQLFSYLKQLKMNMGILICNKIYVYDYDHNKNDNEQSKLEIAFEKDNPDGIRFMELFSKGNFKNTSVSEIIQEKTETEKHLKEIETKITNDYVLLLIKNDLLKIYKDTEVENIIKNLKVSVMKKHVAAYQNPIKQSYTPTQAYNTIDTAPQENGIGKHTAILLFRQNDIEVPGITTFASLNKSAQNYWANPQINLLNKDWSLILNDFRKKELHLFYIPANTLTLNQLKVRSDKPKHIDLQISYYSNTFRDSRSGLNFLDYLVKTIKY